MGQVLHGCATTTEAVRRAIQDSQASLRALARRHGVNPKTIAKWRKRSSVHDLRTSPTDPRSTVLSAADEAVVVAFRRHTLLPLDDCLYALQATIPHLTRSSLHRCLQRHGISRLPEIEGDKPAKQKFRRYPIGFFHIDIAEVRTAGGKLYLFVGIDRTSKFAFVQLVDRANTVTASVFLDALVGGLGGVDGKDTHDAVPSLFQSSRGGEVILTPFQGLATACRRRLDVGGENSP